MGNLFKFDGKVYRFLEKLANVMGASLLWTLFSLPLFTVGASTTALYWTVHKAIRSSNGGIWKEFWNSFKSNFRQATVLWIILLLSLIFLAVDCYFSYILSDSIPVLKWILLLLVIIFAFLIMWSLYLFPYIAHIQDPIKTVFKNTLIMCVFHLLPSLSLFVAFVLCIWAIFAFSFSPALFALLPAGYMYFACIILKQVFNNYWDVDNASTENNQ